MAEQGKRGSVCIRWQASNSVNLFYRGCTGPRVLVSIPAWMAVCDNCGKPFDPAPGKSVVKESLTAQPDPNGSIRPESDETAPVRVHDKP